MHFGPWEGTRMRTVPTVASLVLVAVVGVAQPDAGPGTEADDELTPRARAWQEGQIAGLAASRPSAASKILEVICDAPDRVEVNYAYGLFWLGPEDWAYMISFASHDQESQIALIIARDGRVYRTFQHVCPRLFLSRPEGLAMDSIEAFLQTMSMENREPCGWELIDGSYATPDRDELLTAQEHQQMLAVAPAASADARKLALRALIRDGSDESWEVVNTALDAITDWAIIDDARQTAASVDEAKGEYIAALQQARLNADPQQRTEQQLLAILSAVDRGALGRFTSLVEDDDTEAMCARIEAFCRSYTVRAATDRTQLARLRNVVNAYGALDAERAGTFFSSLLEEPPGALRRAGVYGVGELRVADAVAELRTMAVPAYDGFLGADSVCVALGKISTPQAHQALADLLLQLPTNTELAGGAMAAMKRVCGGRAGSPWGTWANGCWATVAEDRVAAAESFAEALNTLADRTDDEELADRARHEAEVMGYYAYRP